MLYGYVRINTTEYVINWTMPFCVLVLRVIGLAFDLSDHDVADKDKSDDQVGCAPVCSGYYCVYFSALIDWCVVYIKHNYILVM